MLCFHFVGVYWHSFGGMGLFRTKHTKLVIVMLLFCTAQIGLFVTFDFRVRPAPYATTVDLATLQQMNSNEKICTVDGFGSKAELIAQGYDYGDSLAPTVSGGGWKKGSIAPWGGFNPPTTTYLSFDIKTPSSLPGSGEFYYVLLSVIDSAGSYDQVGFSADFGHWGLTWSWTSVDWLGGYTYHYDPSAITLAKNTWYKFEMAISNGYLTYSLVVGGWTEWTKTVYTGGSYFYLTNLVQVGIFTYPDFTNYEEVYYTDGDTPDFNFKFKNTQTSSDYWDDWNEYSAGSYPSGVGVTISETYHYVYVTNPDAP